MMRVDCWWLISVTLFCSRALWAQDTLDVVYPREGQRVAAYDSTFIFGSTRLPGAKISINGFPVKLNVDGAFLTVVPISRGEFRFVCQAANQTDTLQTIRTVFIPPYLATTPSNHMAVDSSYVFPTEDLHLSSGDYLEVSFKGTPGFSGSFTVPGLVEDAPMIELPSRKDFFWGGAVFGSGGDSVTPEIDGIYTGIHKIPAGVVLDSAEIRFELNAGNGTCVAVTAPGRLTVRDQTIPQIGELIRETTVARTGPGLGYHLFLPPGVKLWLTGQQGRYYRAR
ncbi:MAG TPA: hypothetical protein VGA99_04570, partial [bacterium]